MKKLISVIIPVYNVEKYIDQCIDSLTNQTYKDLEIILIDDGSKDNSGKICDEYAKKDSRISVIHKQNEGVSAARNTGLELAKGEYVAFVDSDDFVDSNYILCMYNKMVEQDADMVFCKYTKVFDRRFVNVKEHLPKSIVVNMNDESFVDFLAHFLNFKENILGCCWRLLFKRKQLSGLRFETNIRICEDLLFILGYIFSSKRIASIDEQLYFYRQINSSACHSYKKGYLKNQLLLHKGLLNLFDSVNKKSLKSKFKIYSSLLCYYCFSNEIKFNVCIHKQNIKDIRKSELYQYFSIKNGLRIYGLKRKLKYLIIWILVKTRLV